VQLHIALLNTSVETMSFTTHKDTVMQLINIIKRWFGQPTYFSDLDRYITDKHPQSAAEVEHYEREFNRKLSQGKIL
jgi:hypothetical protein